MWLRSTAAVLFQQDSCGEEERPSLDTMVKPSPKPRRARLLPKGRKLNNKKRGRPKKVTAAVEKKNQKNQSALDLLHAKTLSAAPPQGQKTHTHTHKTQLSWAWHAEFTTTHLHCHVSKPQCWLNTACVFCFQMHTGHLRVPSTSYLPTLITIPLINCFWAQLLLVCNNS